MRRTAAAPIHRRQRRRDFAPSPTLDGRDRILFTSRRDLIGEQQRHLGDEPGRQRSKPPHHQRRHRGQPRNRAAPTASCGGRKATIIGTKRADKLTGGPLPDVITGLGGKDKIKGLGKNDVLCGGKGRDRISGGKGRDRIIGGPGVDKIRSGPGRDRVTQ